jgi:hypothetical protein
MGVSVRQFRLGWMVDPRPARFAGGVASHMSKVIFWLNP